MQREVGEDAGVGQHHPLDRAVRDVALVPERHVFERRDDRGRIIRARPVRFSDNDRVALVGHGRAALLPGGEILLDLADLRSLQVADLGRQPLDPGRHQGQRPVKAACRSRGITWVEIGSGRSPNRSATAASTRGSTLAKVPIGPGHGAGEDLVRAWSMRRRSRSNSAKWPASLSPKVVGSA